MYGEYRSRLWAVLNITAEYTGMKHVRTIHKIPEGIVKELRLSGFMVESSDVMDKIMW